MAAWTEERRKAQSDKLKARGGIRGKAQAPTLDPDPEPELLRPDGLPFNEGASTISGAEMFMARMKAKPAVTTEDNIDNMGGEGAEVLEPGAGSNVTHTSAGRVWMYKEETWGWRRLAVSRNSIADLISAGFLDRCGACGSTSCPGTFNGCSKGKMRKYIDCPLGGCRQDGGAKRFYDVQDVGAPIAEPTDGLAIISVYARSTPESRIKAQVDAHLRAYHSVDAEAMGLMNIQAAAAR